MKGCQRKSRRSFSLVEVVVACVLMAVLFYGGHAGLGTFARPVGRGDL